MNKFVLNFLSQPMSETVFMNKSIMNLFTHSLIDFSVYTFKQQALPFDLLNDFPHIFHKLARILCLLHLLKTYIPCIYALDLWYILLTITLLQHYITKVNCFFSFFYKSLKKFKFLNIYICLFKIIPLYGRGLNSKLSLAKLRNSGEGSRRKATNSRLSVFYTLSRIVQKYYYYLFTTLLRTH